MSGLGINIEPNVDIPTAGQTYNLLNDDKINRWGNAISSFQNIPGLIGFWPMSSVELSTGNAYDLSGQDRILTYNGNPEYNIHNDFMPYIELDGTGDFLSRPDEIDLDITGTEIIYNSSVRGLTLGGWFWFDVLGANVGMIGKWVGYTLQKLANDEVRMIIDNATVRVEARIPLPGANQWVFCVGRFVPSISITVFANGNSVTNITAILASILNTTTPFSIGQLPPGTQRLDGRASLCFVSANALPTPIINGLFQQSRLLFEV